jgi:hypothetical protein
MNRLAIALLVLLTCGGAAAGQPAAPQRTTIDSPELSPTAVASVDARATFCRFIDTAAAEHAIPVEFFTRLLWQESSFRASAVSPKGAQGIAQFMPATAAERGLADPFDASRAIVASARLLNDLRLRFGNLGLAAAAYNAGPARVTGWLAGTRELPRETREYVAAITGRPVEDWLSGEAFREGLQEKRAGGETCVELVALIAVPPALSPLPAALGSADWQPWGVQLAVSFSQERALASYRAMQRRHPAILAERSPLVLRKRDLSRGTKPLVQVRLPAPTRQAANELCRELRAGGSVCVVLRN